MEKWQKCPACEGIGLAFDPNAVFTQSTYRACDGELMVNLETGLPPGRHRALVERTEVQGFEYDPKLYENVNDRIPRMENPPPPPPIKGKSRSHVL